MYLDIDYKGQLTVGTCLKANESIVSKHVWHNVNVLHYISIDALYEDFMLDVSICMCLNGIEHMYTIMASLI